MCPRMGYIKEPHPNCVINKVIRFKCKWRDFQFELMLSWEYFWRLRNKVNEYYMSDKCGISGARGLTKDNRYLYNIKSSHSIV